MDTPTIRAIFAMRGGYGTSRIISEVNWNLFQKHPKWLIGFSDITTLLSKIGKLGIASVHGDVPMYWLEHDDTLALSSLKQVLFTGNTQLTAGSHPNNRSGEVEAPVVGGNLTVLCSNIGTPQELDTNGKILVLEDVGEELYRLDRALLQLQQADKLKNLAGLVFGHMTDITHRGNPVPDDQWKDVLYAHVKAYSFPVGFGFSIGHEVPNAAFPHHTTGKLSVHKNGSSLAF